MHRNIGQKPYPLRKPLKDDLLYTYMKVCMGWISYFSVQAVQKLDGIPQIHCGVWEKNERERRPFFFFGTVGDFFFFFFPFVLYTYSKRDKLRVFFKEGFWVLWLKKKKLKYL